MEKTIAEFDNRCGRISLRRAFGLHDEPAENDEVTQIITVKRMMSGQFVITSNHPEVILEGLTPGKEEDACRIVLNLLRKFGPDGPESAQAPITIGAPVAGYRQYLERAARAAQNGLDATGLDFHAGAHKAYMDALEKLELDRFNGEESAQPRQESKREERSGMTTEEITLNQKLDVLREALSIAMGGRGYSESAIETLSIIYRSLWVLLREDPRSFTHPDTSPVPHREVPEPSPYDPA